MSQASDPVAAAIIAEALTFRADTFETYARTNSPHPTHGDPVELMERVLVLRREAERLMAPPRPSRAPVDSGERA